MRARILLLAVPLAACQPTFGTLTVHVDPEGAGTIADTKGNARALQNCTTTCTATIGGDPEAYAKLEATPANGTIVFLGWSGSAEGCSGLANSVGLNVDGDVDCTAHFGARSYFYVGVSPPDSGSVVVSGLLTSFGRYPGIYNSAIGASTHLKAIPANGYLFDHWKATGNFPGCTGNKLDIDVTLAADASDCDAVFISIKYYELLHAIALDSADEAQVAASFKSGDDGACTPLSDDSVCQIPALAQLLDHILDPRLEIDAAAATRLFGDVFPCGQGPSALTICASSNPPPAGEWIYLEDVYGAPLPTADPTGFYQLAWVFDADGIATNNYVPAPAYPKDFFANTDKWYELDYSPSGGWKARVRDVRLGLADVPSDARFVILGNELAIFVPASELDGAAPTFRTTSFRHEGDFGLMGGPWSGDYFPVLGQPLLPVATTSFVVPP